MLKKVYIVIGCISKENWTEIFEIFNSISDAKKEIKEYKIWAKEFGYDRFWIEEWDVH